MISTDETDGHALRTLVRRVRTPVGDPAWLVQDHDLIRELLKDSRLGRSHTTPERAARLSSTSIFGGAQLATPTEQADHTHMRRMLAPLFSARRMAAIERHVVDQVEQCLDELAATAEPGDVHSSLSSPLHVRVACILLGIPKADHPTVHGWSEDVADLHDPERSVAGWNALWTYLLDLVARKRHAPGDDALSELIVAAGGEPGADQQVAEFGAQLFAGHSTIIAAIDEGTVLLLSQRERWEALRTRPDLLPGAVEEILRLCLPTARPGPPHEVGTGLPRWARADFDVDGSTVRKGDLVLLDLQAANLDARRFSDPDVFDPERPENQHLTFGGGAMHCIGRALARIELQAVFRALPERFPLLRLAARPEDLVHRDDSVIGGLSTLPVVWS